MKLMNIQNRLYDLNIKLCNKKFVKIINGGLIMLFPVVLVGAFSLIAQSFPIPEYQYFIHHFCGGFFNFVFGMIYNGTFGILSIHMTITTTISYQRETKRNSSICFAEILTALGCFIILTGVLDNKINPEAINAKGMISALISAYFSSMIFGVYDRFFHRNKSIYCDGADVRFNKAISAIPAAALTFLTFAAADKLLLVIFNATSFQFLINRLLSAMFASMKKGFLSGFLFVFVSSVLWIFGFHGNDCLEAVNTELFQPSIEKNIYAVSQGSAPTEIVTRQFLDIFVSMGGCGSSICLLIALIIFGKRRSDKRLSKLAAVPVLFNINEVLLYGLPVILNPILFIPFLATPIVCYLTSYFAMKIGLVPLTVATVEWTTPVILGGYLTTNSIAGAALQLFNIVLGVIIYAPFINFYDKGKISVAKEKYRQLVEYYKTFEETGHNENLIDLENDLGGTAKIIAMDLKDMLKKGEVNLYYQPQMKADGSIFGVEALLRWNHPLFGMIYPPLIIKIADESHLLTEFEKTVIKTAVAALPNLKEQLGDDIVLSCNITDKTLRSQSFVEYFKTVVSKGTNLCLEITEQTALQLDTTMCEVLSKIKAAGGHLAIDDFSMGQTSINYLKDRNFDLVKLDGSLIRGIIDNPRCVEIVSSIVTLSEKLGLNVLAEYVESTEIRDKLLSIGCTFYQGYLYSPALPVKELKTTLKACDGLKKIKNTVNI